MRSTTVDIVSLILTIWCLGPLCQCRYQLAWPSSSITTTNNNNNDYLWTGDALARLRSSAPVSATDSDQLGYSWAGGRGALYRKQRNGMSLAAASNLEYPMLPASDPEEPSCEELRTIWHLTKRAARHSLLTNEIPTQPTSMFGYLIDSPDRTSSTYGLSDGQAFGRIVLEPTGNHRRMRPRTGSKALSTGSFDLVEQQLREGGIFADAPFHKLGKNVRYQSGLSVVGGYSRPRAFRQPGDGFRNAYAGPYVDRDRTVAGVVPGRKYGGSGGRSDARLYGVGRDGPSVVYGMYSSPNGLIDNDNNNDYAKQGKPHTGRGSGHPMRGATYVRQGQHLKSAKIYGNTDAIVLSDEPFVSNSGNEIETQMAIDKLLPSPKKIPTTLFRDAVLKTTVGGVKPKQVSGSEKVRIGFSQDGSGCKDVKIKYCQTDKDCACYGLYKCVWGKCKNSSTKSKGPINGIWHDKAILTPKTEPGDQTYTSLSQALEASSKLPPQLSARKSVSQLSSHNKDWPASKTPQYYLRDMSSLPRKYLPSSTWLPMQLLQKGDEDRLRKVLPSHHRKL